MGEFVKTSGGVFVPQNYRPLVAKHKNLRVWADNGLICMVIEQKDGQEVFRQLNVFDAAERVAGLADGLQKDREMLGIDPTVSRESIRLYAQFLEDFKEVIKKALEQGPYEFEDMRRDRVRRRKIQVSVPAADSL